MSLARASVSRTPSPLGQVLFHPASVALVGVSDDPARTTGRPLSYLRRSAFEGTVYPVNPNRARVQGETAWPAIGALPEVPEQVFVMTPTARVLDVVRECVELGVPVVTILADGFTESGATGQERTRQLREQIAGSATRLVGPSSLGVVNHRNGLVLTANAAFAEGDPLVGHTLAVSQSGSMIGALTSRGKALGVGFAALVSVGNEIDVNVGEICAATLDDPDVHGYALFLESVSGADSIRRFAEAARRRNRPVVAYKLGRSAAGAELAQSHTGALAGEEEVSAAFFADCGIARVRTLDALLEGVSLAGRVPLPGPSGSPRVGVLTSTGGGAAMVVDQLGVLGIDVRQPSDATFAKLAGRGAGARTARIVDLTLAGAQYPVMSAALDTLIEAGEHDVLIVVVGSSARLDPEAAVLPIAERANSRVPLAAFIVPEAPRALALLTAAGVPCFRSPEACADAVAAVLSRRDRTIDDVRASGVPTARMGETATTDAVLDEHTAYAVIDSVGIPRPELAVVDGDDLPPLPFDFPVVAKVLSAAISHKTDLGGVVLGIDDTAGLLAAVDQIRANIAHHRPDLAAPHVLVQPMVNGVAEVLVGYRIDREVGPVVLVAAGGELAEVYADRSIRLAPVDHATALDMIGEVRSLRVLHGFRGRPPGDVTALADAIVRVSQLAARGDVRELEINPLIVQTEGKGVVAVDALVRVSAANGERNAS
jgi:acyl-CoA synthetase (NDP forming)